MHGCNVFLMLLLLFLLIWRRKILAQGFRWQSSDSGGNWTHGKYIENQQEMRYK